MRVRSKLLGAAIAVLLAVAGPAQAFDGEQALYEAAKKEKPLTWYTAHYDSETAAAVTSLFDRPAESVLSTTHQARRERLPLCRCCQRCL